LNKISELGEYKWYSEVLHRFENFLHVFELYQVYGALGQVYNKHGQYFIPSGFDVEHHLSQTNTILDAWHIHDCDVLLVKNKILRDGQNELDSLDSVDLLFRFIGDLCS
jgi:hypothetical protein